MAHAVDLARFRPPKKAASRAPSVSTKRHRAEALMATVQRGKSSRCLIWEAFGLGLVPPQLLWSSSINQPSSPHTFE